MNSLNPFDADSDWTLDPYHCNQSNDPLVDKVIGNAYAVVRAVYCNLGNLKLLYDFLNTYGMVLAVNSEAELKKLNKSAKYARIYGYASTGDRQVTDYLYVPDDTSGIIPDDPTATGSWVKVATSPAGVSEGIGQGSYIPYVYARGSALGGETSFKVPEGTIGVPFLIINNSTHYIGFGFDYSADTATVTLTNPLALGDEVIALTTSIPASPDNPGVPDWVQINWLYNNGSAEGGEQVITVPYNFQDVPAIYKNGLRLYKGLQSNSYVIDKDTRTITMTEILAQGDRVIVTLGGEAETITVIDRTLQEVARANDVKDTDVVFSSNTHVVITGKKIIYDVDAQKSWALPDLPPNAYIVSVNGDQLTYNPGNVTVTLLSTFQQVNTRELWKRSLAEAGLTLVNGSFEDGATVNDKTDAVWYVAGGRAYIWNGSIPLGGKVVAPGSTPETSGGIGSNAWESVSGSSLRESLSATDGASIIGGGTYTEIRAFTGEGNKINCIGRENIFDGGNGVFLLDASDTTSSDNDGTILVDASGRRWKREFSGDINPIWFGVKFDGVTPCHAEWQKCIDSAKGEWINVGSHTDYSVVAAPLTVRHHMKIRGVNSSYNGSPNSWIHGTHTGNIFELAETTRGMRIEGIYFSGQGCTALNSNSFYWADTILKDCSFDLSLNYGMKGQFIEVYTDKCQFGVGALGVPAHENWTPVFGTWTSTPFQMSNVCTFNRCRFEHSKSAFGALIWAGAYLLNLQNCIFQYNTGGNTIVLTQGVTNVDFDSCYFEANSGNSFLWDANREGTGTRAYGRYKFTNNYADTRDQAISAVISTYDQPIEIRRNYIFGNAADYYLTRNSNGGAFETGTISAASDNYLVGGYVGKYNRNQHVIAGGAAGRATLNAPIATTPTGAASLQLVGVSNTAGAVLQLHNSNTVSSTDYQPTGKIQFCNGGTVQHHITGYTNRELVFGLNGTDYAQLSASYFAPWTDNQISAGTSSKRFTQVYAATSAISTSDETKKSEFFDVTEAERNAALEIKASIRKFKKLDAVEKKGFDGARWHFGVGAQTVGDIMRKHGLDPDMYGFWCHDVWEAQPEQAQEWEAEYDSEGNEIKPAFREVIKEAEEGGEIYGIRYEELAMFILASI